MKKNHKNAPQTLTGQRGEHQNTGKLNNTISKRLRVLSWLYCQTIHGLTCTAFESFNQNQDTSFTTRVSALCYRYGLEIPRRQVKNSNTGTYYNEYWLSDDDIGKVTIILNKG